jgi:hypothetical protein
MQQDNLTTTSNYLSTPSTLLTKVHSSHDGILNETNVVDYPPEPAEMRQQKVRCFLARLEKRLEPSRPVRCMSTWYYIQQLNKIANTRRSASIDHYNLWRERYPECTHVFHS